MAVHDHDSSSDGDEGRKPKRQKRVGSNPLADARRNSQQQSKAENLWHRKSGAGFQLFVQYYAHQPIGCVVSESSALTQPPPTKPTQLVGAGLSRAAKKRKKKKASTNTDEGPREEEEINVETTGGYDVSDSKLLKAWICSAQLTKSQPGYLHLKPYLEALSKPLPLTFRLREGNLLEATKTIQDELQAKHGQLVKPYAFGNIFQSKSCHLSKASLTKQSPSLKAFLVQHSADGTLARQEFGSMLPVLGLELTKHSRVLDVCASPGSKVLQALEVVGVKGRIVANDVHPTRLETLKDAVSRAGLSPALTNRVIYANFDAGIFPTPKNDKLFDAVVCDVPCSGDGTIRKDKHVLPLWTTATGNSLHALQVRILMRALQLVRVGGMVSYSTCSLNPIEDEAVVASVVSRMNAIKKKSEGGPALELADFPKLPGFVSRPGIKDWRVADYVGDTQNDQDDDSVSLRWHATYKEAMDAKMDKAVSSMWPPSKEDVDLLHLERCIRLWPHDQDTGGFFVALIRKNH
jgi:16S rRNA C967 or C1407 C5-methylase (RsmB/RsmF family)